MSEVFKYASVRTYALEFENSRKVGSEVGMKEDDGKLVEGLLEDGLLVVGMLENPKELPEITIDTTPVHEPDE